MRQMRSNGSGRFLPSRCSFTTARFLGSGHCSRGSSLEHQAAKAGAPMSPAFGSTLFKLLMPLAGIVIILAVARKRGLSWTEDIRLVWPSPQQLAVWVALRIV